MIEKIERQNRLFDCYGGLLTEKQQVIFCMHYQDDFSYQEIAENLSISRTAVYDTLKRVEYLLEYYEDKLHILKRDVSLECFLSELMTCGDKDVKLTVEKFKKEEGKFNE